MAIQEQGRVIAVRNDRLGGRLGALLNAKRIADDYSAGFAFTWSSHEAVSPELQKPEELFSKDFLEEYRETRLGFGELQESALAVENLPAGCDRDWLTRQLAERNLRCSEAMQVVRLPWEDQGEVAERLVQTLGSIQFNPVVKQAMERIRDSLGDVALVAYHLRRGDIIDPAARPSNVLWPTKYIPRVFYEEHIGRVLAQDPDARIVIFSDAPHEIDAFCALSPRVIPAARLIDDEDLAPLQRDFLELYTMSLCKRIFAPGASAFSRLAALLGNSQVIPITSDLTAQEREHALNRLTQQLDQSPEVFAGDADLGQNFPELIAFHNARKTPHVARAILQKHHDRGFRQSYIHDLLAEQHFWAGDSEAALNLARSLKERPILTDLGNAQVYAWAGLAALADNRTKEATRMAHIAQWLQPNLPIARILIGGLVGAKVDPACLYPVAPELVLLKRSMVARFAAIAERLSNSDTTVSNRRMLSFIPFELDIRDWRDIQSLRLPSAFWNVPNQHKMIGFFRSTYRRQLELPQVRSLLGQLHFQAEDQEVGKRLIEEAYDESRGDSLIAIRRARMMWAEGRQGAALKGFAEAAELSGQHICHMAEQGVALVRAGKKGQAIDVFKRISERDHDFVEIHITTADVLRRQGKTRDLALKVAAHVDDMVPGGLRTAQIHRKVLEQTGHKQQADQIVARFKAWNRSCGKFSSRVGSAG
ncbi:hypothetical protein [Paracoccus seriniphilus]|uniref:Uncharacterized protein n=1 Tax=Paracoccus seriniphilus TaxID=184748 RepID=A0A239Q1H2_9RHOB|nr:hypothetical protein [Paracoccus seriniphilus]WCR15902.1 hypothetical protein JHW44_17665 [Paracoccus seriniphilus]SNT76325.1 hypothetical protein SAMN05444959_11834 [Paracoccus seriniphilus]